jgi:hypothetical protein
MSIISAIGNPASGGLKELVLGVLDQIKLNAEEKAKIQAQMDLWATNPKLPAYSLSAKSLF